MAKPNFQYRRDILNKGKVYFMLLMSAAYSYLMMQIYIGAFSSSPVRDIVNMVYYLGPLLTVYFITQNPVLSIIIQQSIVLLFIIINLYLIKFKGNVLMPWDLYSFRTAQNVAGRYDLTPDAAIISIICFTLVFTVFTCFYLMKVKTAWKIRSLRKRAVGAAVSIISVFAVTGMLLYTDVYPIVDARFNQKIACAENGVVVNFINGIKEMDVKAPDGYRDFSAEEYLGETVLATRKPNVIVIMCEAFSDMGVHSKIQTDTDYLPFVHDIMDGYKNTQSGYMYVSCCGGDTAITEYEFLTGNPQLFLPGGAIAYQQYINSGTDLSYALPSYLNEMGYQSVAMHPYQASGYNRQNVYPLFGFDRILFEKDFGENAEKIRGLISDKCTFNKIIDLYENKKKDSPIFAFCVTMQNHSPYSEKDSTISVTEEAGFVVPPELYETDFDIVKTKNGTQSLDNYLSLVALSDKALKDLIDYFDRQNEETIIVFFGDHQPGHDVADAVSYEGEENINFIKIPFLIHTNFDIEEKTGIETSPCFLQNIMLETAGLGMNNYQAFIRKVRDKHKALSILGEVSNGKLISDEEAMEDGWIDTYRNVWYYFFTKKKFE